MMNWCDQTLGIDRATDMTQESRAQVDARLARLPMADLVRGWREKSIVTLREQTRGTHCFDMYFDRLGHDDPERALAFLEAEVTSEPNEAIGALVAQDKLVTELLHFNAARVAGGLEEAAARLPRLRWLFGAIAWSLRSTMVTDKAIARRLLALADEGAYT